MRDKDAKPFRYVDATPIRERLHEIDFGAGGRIQMPQEIINPDTRDRYLIDSLIDEAITSSQLEGAATTRKVAREMIRTGRQASGRSEQMILNNYLLMREIGKLKAKPLTAELVFEIHRQITEGTLDLPGEAGRFRRPDEPVHVADESGNILYVPPPAEQLEERMQAMCDFANDKTPEAFVHPAIRSIILHFWLAYDHPFVDGNGRTARMLFYWSMLRHDFWLFEFIAISQIIRKAPAQYIRAFLYTETDANDLTYFILYHVKVIDLAIRALHEYIKRKTSEVHAVERRLHGATLNHRQRALISHALRHPIQEYTIRSHRVSHNVAYETARRDLFNLRDRGLLDVKKIGRTYCFTPASELEEKLGKQE